MRFNPRLGAFDGHCRQPHCATGDCKVDRKLAKGAIGFVVSWLASPHDNRDMHQLQKIILSSSDRLPTRQAARKEFEGFANELQGDFMAAWSMELELRGTNEEPNELYCAPLRAFG